MADAEQQHDDTGTGERDLPEAFTMNIGKNVSPLNQPSDTARTSTGLDKAQEGSEESFPASDPPSTMAQSTAPKQPVQPQE